MITLLLKHFIPDYRNTKDPEVRMRYGTFSGGLGIFFNLCLFLLKLLSGILSHSIAVIADAMNSLSDAGSSVLTIVGFHLAFKKPDAEHPFGHGRVEYLTGLFVNIIILIVGFELAHESLGRILHPEETAFTAVTILILLVSVAVKLYMYFANRKLAGMIGSEALMSTANDARNDAITTGVVLLSGLFTRITGIGIDGWTGLAVSVFILWSGVSACMDVISPLLGQEPDAKLLEEIRRTALSAKGVLGVHDIIVHDYGPGRRMMSLHAEVSSDMTLVDAHEIADSLEQRFSSEYRMPTVIHVDPVDLHDPDTQKTRNLLARFLREISPEIRFHDFRIIRERGRRKILFDIALPYSWKEDPEILLRHVKSFLLAMDPSCRPLIHVDRYDSSEEDLPADGRRKAAKTGKG